MKNSIRFRLVLWFLVVFMAGFLGLGVFVHYKLEEIGLGLVDDHLKSSANTISNLLSLEAAQGHLDSGISELSTSIAGEYAEKFSGHYYQILSSGGKILVRSPSLSLGDAYLPVMETPSGEFRYAFAAGPNNEQLRLISVTFTLPDGLRLTSQVADSLADTYKLLSYIRNAALLMFPAVFILCGLGVYVLAGIALKPLKAFSAKATQITAENLGERLEERGTVEELKSLAAAFNTMLGRLEGSFMRQRQFLSDASHELRTPTSIIKSFCDVTLGRERSTQDYREAIKKMSDTVNRMCDIINRILVVSRLDSKAIQFKPVRVELKDIMKDVLKLIEPSASNKGIRLALAGADVNIRCDREGITEVFTNIVENSIKYNRPDGRVDVNIAEEGGWAVITVSDTGIGIPPEDMERIFDRFYRVDASRGRTVGSGLGLSIVRSIVEASGGNVEVRSELGKGTTFIVRLPKKAEQRDGGAQTESI